MSTDLHARLLAAVRQRMETARAANYYRTEPQYVPGEVLAWAKANDPATIIRHCERDLKVLERHVDDHGGCAGCGANRYDEYDPWPCQEITDLAAAYGIEVDG